MSMYVHLFLTFIPLPNFVLFSCRELKMGWKAGEFDVNLKIRSD